VSEFDTTTVLGDAGREPGATNSSLRHVLIVGGDLDEWASLSGEQWLERVDDLGAFCSRLGVRWLTLRAYGPGTGTSHHHLERWEHRVHSCDVIVDPSGDGRERFASAMERLDRADEVNEATVAVTLYEPADSEPDLVVILGPSTQLPPSLVWELAYAELVFIDTTWDVMSADDLSLAVDDFANRRRRFGGLDDVLDE